ncbi:MAG: virulence factor SrfB, partial [Pseudomonadota bacterium]
MSEARSGTDTLSQRIAGARARTLPADAEHERPLVALVRDSGIQLLDLTVNAGMARLVALRFLEELAQSDDGESAERVLHRVRLEDDVIAHPVDGRPVPWSQTYAIAGGQAMAHFAKAWLPLPILRVTGTDQRGFAEYDQGPGNWARVFVGPETPDALIRVTVAIDTSVLTAFGQGRAVPELAPTIDDVEDGAVFRVAYDADDVAGFVSEEWVEAWARAHLARSGAFRRGEDGAPGELWHVAAYLTFLETLGRGLELPDIMLID